jgi:hypothetical protein
MILEEVPMGQSGIKWSGLWAYDPATQHLELGDERAGINHYDLARGMSDDWIGGYIGNHGELGVRHWYGLEEEVARDAQAAMPAIEQAGYRLNGEVWYFPHTDGLTWEARIANRRLESPDRVMEVLSGMTRPQLLKVWKDLSQEAEGITREYDFGDGWWIGKANKAQNANAIGCFMRNCWQGINQDSWWEGGTLGWTVEGDRDWAKYYALFDPDGLPVLAFNLRPVWQHNPKADIFQQRPNSFEIQSPLEARNARPDPKHLKMVWQWAASVPEETYYQRAGDYYPVGIDPEVEAERWAGPAWSWRDGGEPLAPLAKIAMPYANNVFYHGTHKANLDSIIHHGLQPREWGQMSLQFPEHPAEEEAVYLWPTIGKVYQWIEGWDWEDFEILRIRDIDRGKLAPDHEEFWEWINEYASTFWRDRIQNESKMYDDFRTGFERPGNDQHEEYAWSIGILRELSPATRSELAEHLSEDFGYPMMYYGSIPSSQIDLAKSKVLDEYVNEIFDELHPEAREGEPDDLDAEDYGDRYDEWVEEYDQAFDAWLSAQGEWVSAEEFEEKLMFAYENHEDDEQSLFRFKPLVSAKDDDGKIFIYLPADGFDSDEGVVYWPDKDQLTHDEIKERIQQRDPELADKLWTEGLDGRKYKDGAVFLYAYDEDMPPDLQDELLSAVEGDRFISREEWYDNYA